MRDDLKQKQEKLLLMNISYESNVQKEVNRHMPKAKLGLERAAFHEALVGAMERLLRDTAEPHSGPFNGEPSRCKDASRIKVIRVLRVANQQLWRQYDARKEILKRYSPRPLRRTARIGHLENVAFRTCPEKNSWIDTDKSVNEMLLFHGTRASTAESIATHGFDINRVRQGLYGNGFYFACEACKSFQYSQECNLHGEQCILVALVVLGRTKYATGPLKGGKGDVLTNTEDSVAVFPENVPGQHHHEFVVFDKDQVFPEFIVYFTT